MAGNRLRGSGLIALVLGASCLHSNAAGMEQLPRSLSGTWRIVRVLPTTNESCWSRSQAQSLVDSKLTYGQDAMRWRGGEVPLLGITTRTVTAEQFQKENGGDHPASFAQLGIHAPSVTEVDMQHEDADITGATTEVPGDAVLLASPSRIVVSACGIYMEAVRDGGSRRK